MKLLLLSLAGLLLGGEAFRYDAMQGPSVSRPIIYILPSFHDRVRAAQHAMVVKMDAQGMRRRYVLMRPSLAPSRVPIIASHQSHSLESDRPGLGQTRTSEVSQDFAPSNSANPQSPSPVSQGHKPSSFGQIPKTPTISHHKPSGIGEVQDSSTYNQDSKPLVSDQQQRRPSGFVQASKPLSHNNPNHESSSSHEERNQSAFNEDFKPSNSDEDRKLSSFGEDKKPLNQDSKPSFFDKHGSHPDRNPVCNQLPDVGTCRAALPRYYFDPETGTCNCFLYGGCREDGQGESPGSFFTLEECHQECHPPKLEEGPVCKNIFKEDKFISYLVDVPPQQTQTDHLNDEEFLASFYK